MGVTRQTGTSIREFTLRILITTNMLVSHFLPMLPFAQGLKKRGHDVKVAAVPELGEEIIKHGFDHLVLRGPTEQELGALNERAKHVPREAEGKLFMSQFFMGLAARSALPGLLNALDTWRPELILRESTEFSGLIAAKKLGIRHVRFEIVNGESEESIASNYIEEMDALRSIVFLNPTGSGYLKDEQAFSAHPKILDDTLRVNSRDPHRFRSPTPPAVSATKRPEWHSNRDEPLVYMTFGTVTADEERSRHVYAASLEAVADLPITVLLTTGRNAPPDLISKVPDNVVVRNFVSQAEVFEHADLMVCHGGSGTVLGGLAAGIPMIVVPLFADQTDNARCLAASGLSTTVADDNMAELRAAITDLLANHERRLLARQAADDFAAMPTVEDAIEKLVAG